MPAPASKEVLIAQALTTLRVSDLEKRIAEMEASVREWSPLLKQFNT